MVNGLSDRQMEQLFCLSEECGETIQQVSKVLRHGLDSFSPFDEDKTTNKQNLSREVGNILCWIDFLVASNCLDYKTVVQSKEDKKVNCKPFMHYQ